jgi:hypothetical protein
MFAGRLPMTLDDVTLGALKYEKLNPNLRKSAERHLKNKKITSLTHDLAVIDARADDVLGSIHQGEYAELWNELKKVVTKSNAAIAASTNQDAKLGMACAALDQVSTMISDACEDNASWDEYYRLADLRRRLSSVENKREAIFAGMMPVAVFIEMIRRIGAVVEENVQNERVMRAIADGVRLIIASNVDVAHATGAAAKSGNVNQYADEEEDDVDE